MDKLTLEKVIELVGHHDNSEQYAKSKRWLEEASIRANRQRVTFGEADMGEVEAASEELARESGRHVVVQQILRELRALAEVYGA